MARGQLTNCLEDKEIFAVVKLLKGLSSELSSENDIDGYFIEKSVLISKI